MFDMVFSDGIKRGMAFDGHVKNGAYVTRGGSMISRQDWSRLKQLAADDLPESVRAPHVPSASDAEHRINMLRHYLRGRGLDEESCDQACELARREMTLEEEEPVEDELPIAGARHALFAGESREPGERSFRASGRSEAKSRPALGTLASNKERSMVGEAE
jgi:hypothetical protein